MKTLHLSIIMAFLGFTGLMLSCDNSVYGIWVSQSPQELLNDSATIFVGNITSVNILHFAKTQLSTMEENGTDKNIVRNYTLSLDEYKVDVEEFLENPQNANKITVRQPVTNWSPGMLGGLDEFHVGDRVLFYVKNLDGNNTYSPESFIIPKFCVAKDVLTQKKLEARGESFTIQNGVKVDNNFTANHPIYFVDNENDYTLSGKSFDTLVRITKITGSSPEIVLSKEIHSEAKPCEWIASSAWEFTPQEGEYRMDVTIKEDNKTYAQYNDKFFVKPDVVTSDYVSPLNQLKSGIAANDVLCRPDLQLLVENHEGLPICVKQNSVFKLLHQDWSYPSNCKYDQNVFTAGVGGLITIEKNASNPSSGKSYAPTNSTVVIGWNNTISWINLDDTPSSVTSDWNLFDSSPILPGQDWKHSFECVGNYGYHSEPHPWMRGSIRVLPPDK